MAGNTCKAKVSSLITVLQIADSAFPTGAFSHSIGFEAAIKKGHVRDQNSFRNFILATLENAGSLSLPFIREAYIASDNMLALSSLDKYCDACLNNHVTNRASAQQGQSLILTASEAFPDARLKDVQARVTRGEFKGHHTVMFGCLCAYLDIPLRDCLEVFIFNILKTLLASAVRLGNIGAMQAQRIQFEHQKNIISIIERNMDRTVQESCIRFPLVDIVQNTHDTLFSKLFCS